MVFKSNVIKNINDKETEKFATSIVTEFRATYYEIMRNRIHYEMWTWNNWILNRFIGLQSLTLLDVVGGSVNRDLYFTRQGDKDALGVGNLTFKIKFQEIWDFNIEMLDWQVDDLKNQKDGKAESIDTFVRVILTNGTKRW